MRLIYKLSLLMLLLLPVVASSQETTAPPMSEETKKMMETWMQLAQPGEIHKKLVPLAGSYSIKSKGRFDSASQFMENTGNCEKKAVLGDRWIHEHCTGPGMGGMPPFEGMGLLGYNNYTKQYEAYWFDNMSTMGYVLKGTADASGKVITVNGSYEDPMSKKMKKSRWVWTIEDSNKHKLQLYDTDASGKEFLGAEINYTRK